MQRRLSLALRIGLSLALVALAVWWVDTAELRTALGRLTFWSLLPVVAMHTGDRLLMAFKWQRLLAARHGGLGLAEATRAYYVSSFAGVFLPMTVGADLVRVGALRNHRIGSGRLVASIVVERALGAVSQALFALLAVALVVALQLRADVPFGWLAAALALGTMAALAAIPLSFRLAHRLADRWEEHEGTMAKVGRLAREYAGWRAYPGPMRTFFLLTLLEGLFPIATYWVAARALGIAADAVELTATVPLVYLLARLPVSFGGLGGEQAGFAAAAATVGVMSAAQALAVSAVVSPFALLVALLPGAALWLVQRGRNAPAPPPSH